MPKTPEEIAQSATERKRKERARKAAQGLAEVRGIYAPPSAHPKIKQAVRKLTQKS